MKKLLKGRSLPLMLILIVMVIGILAPVSVHAASITSAKPKFDKSCAYLNKTIYLKWSKIKGAKKYEIQRAKISPSKGKPGKYAKWKVVKKNYIKVSGSGDYRYRVRAISGTQKSKWSVSKRIFGASAKITHFGYTKPDVMFGVTLHEGIIEFRVLVNNKTSSPMGFVESGSRFGEQANLYAINKKTGKRVKKWEADVDIDTGIAKQVNANKSQSLYFTVYGVPLEEWNKYKNCKFMLTSAFYPNPEVEGIDTQMAIACSKSITDSSVAAK